MKYLSTIRLLAIGLLLTATLFLAGCSPLLSAARSGNVAETRQLLDNGADVNENFHGETALIYAAIAGNTEIARLLLERGAVVNASMGYGLTPLVYAAKNQHSELAQLLISHGADLAGARAKLASIGTEGQAGLALLDRLAQQTPSLPQLTQSPQASVRQAPGLATPNFHAPADEHAIAVVIGIEKYQSLPSATYVHDDAELIRAYLRAMGYQDRNIEFLSDERATFSAIRKTIETWLPNRTTSRSRVILYYAGHGAPDPHSGEAYLVPYDGDPNYLPDTGYPLKRLYEKLEKLPAKQVVVLLDACFSGAGGRGVLAQGARSLVRVAKTAPRSSRVAVLTSTQGSQISTSSAEKKHGIFTYYLAEALNAHKRDLTEIYAYLSAKVEDEAKRLNVEQTPDLSPDTATLQGMFVLW